VVIETRFNLDPTIPKVIIIAVLIFIEGIAIPAYTVTTQGRMPNEIECLGFVLTATIQTVTYLLTFMQTGATEPKKPD
jgi:heme/copper-type cytochrome/quinol oxidase subunit 4